jgi:hypothetical protein
MAMGQAALVPLRWLHQRSVRFTVEIATVHFNALPSYRSNNGRFAPDRAIARAGR